MILVIATLCIAATIFFNILRSVASEVKQYRKNVDSMKGIPCENRHWFYGTTRNYPPNQLGFNRETARLKKYPRCLQRWVGPIRSLIVGFHPDISKLLLSGNEPKSYFGYKYFRTWIGDGLLVSKGKKWQRNRRLLTPIFHFDSLKRYVPCANEATMTMMKKWGSEDGKSRSVEVFSDISLMTLDNLLRCMFSNNSGCESGSNKEYLKSVKIFTEEIIIRVRNPFYLVDFIYFLTSHGKRFKDALNVMHRFTEKAIRERAEVIQNCSVYKKTSDYDFLDVLLMSKDENGTGLIHQEIRDELYTFVFEGHDTVTSGLSWAFYNLAAHPDIQELCRSEVNKVLNGGHRVGWDHLTKFEYLTKFIKESLRLYPPVIEISRETNRSCSIKDVYTAPNQACPRDTSDAVRKLPKGFMLALRIFSLHRNPTVWEDPEVFDPKRFDPDNISKRPAHAYVPFSAGPRNCIGQNFAMNEMKVVLAVALSMYRFRLDDSYPKPKIKNSVILRSEEGIHLIVDKL